MTSKGIEFASNNQIDKGLLHFRAATYFEPWREDVWHNLAIGLHTKANEIIERKGPTKKAFKMIAESLAALELAQYLINSLDYNSQVHNYIHSLIQQHYPNKCMPLMPGEPCSALITQREAMTLSIPSNLGERPDTENHIDAVNLLCSDLDSVTSKLTKRDRRLGVPSAFLARQLFVILRVCGVVRVPNVFPAKDLEPLIEAQSKELNAFIKLSDNYTKPVEAMADIIGHRSDKRFEHKLPLNPTFIEKGFYDHWFAIWMNKMILTDDITVASSSYVCSLSGAQEGHAHRDNTPLFSGFTPHLPPQALSLVCPLDPLNEETGATMYQFGSHVLLPNPAYWVDNTNTPFIPLPLERGGFIFFDIRTRHKSTPNITPHTRSIGYAVFAPAWWRDQQNFQRIQSAEWDNHETVGLKSLFSRIDSQYYTKRLEERLSNIPGGKEATEELQSALHDEYQKVELAVL